MTSLLKEVIEQKTKFVVVTGGVCSSIGKGVLTSSLGVLLKNAGYTVSVVKWDPYLNVDPGTMSPLEHGEVFVTDDGAETDLDLGHYERMIGEHLTKDSSVSAGQIFQEILHMEREGEFLGRCIQLVPHVVDKICERILRFALKSGAQFVLIEIGGTVGDMEGEVFLEAVRQLRLHLSSHQMMHCHLSLVPLLSWANEIKTKPTQHSVMLLKKAGLMPDALFLRTEREISAKTIAKIATMCGVRDEYIFQVLTRKPLYKIFLDLKQEGLDLKIQQWFGLPKERRSDLSAWESLIERIEKPKRTFRIGLIAKYVGTNEPYISVIEAIKSACYLNMVDPEIVTIEAERLDPIHKDTEEGKFARAQLASVNGIVMPGGFDKRGIEGKIFSAKWAREHKIPYLGLCLGMQILLIECARSLAGLTEATSTEFDPSTKQPLISLLDEQQGIVSKGASMRLGVFPCTIKKDSKAHQAYGQDKVLERHRHRYEFNNAYRSALEAAGVTFSGIYEAKNLVEIAELNDHPFMVGSQFHPEFLSTPLVAHPLFRAFIEAIMRK